MGTLSSELGVHAGRIAGQPRVYVDANVPAGLVAFMRTDLHWDVLFVIEHEDLRRERDGEHFRLARELRRTLITLDRDYLDDRFFPEEESGGVIVLSAPDQSLLCIRRKPVISPLIAAWRASARRRLFSWTLSIDPCVRIIV